MERKQQQRPLTQKMEAFCVEYVRLGEAGRAYRASYDAKNSSNATVWVEASRLLDDPRIEARIAELRAKVAKRAEIQIADVIRELWKNSQEAQLGVNPQLAASNQALIAIGNHLGAFVKRTEAKTPLDNLSHAELKDLIANLQQAKERHEPAAERPTEPESEPEHSASVVPFPRSVTP